MIFGYFIYLFKDNIFNGPMIVLLKNKKNGCSTIEA